MATVPIVTEVTKAQLDALAASNGLNEGLQYKVTDKNWLLTATSENTLKASTGTLVIVNEAIPNYISSNQILLDTGDVIYTPIDAQTNACTPLEVIKPLGYSVNKAYILTNNDVASVNVVDQNGEFDLLNAKDLISGVKYVTFPVPVLVESSIYTSQAFTEGNLLLNVSNSELDFITTPTVRVIIDLSPMLL